MLKLRDLATRADFAVGPMTVSPSRRKISGPEGSAHLEPLIMQVLLLLLDSGGRVVTRDEMFDQLWGGAGVGDDSLNRAVAKLRRATASVAPGLVEIETIPRTGYRVTGPISSHALAEPAPAGATSGGITRRTLVASAAAAAAVAGGVGLWSLRADENQRFNALVDDATEDLDYGDPSRNPVPKLQKAVAMRPRDARAQGLLAFALLVGIETVFHDRPETDIEAAKRAADTALLIDPKQPEARLARIMLQKAVLDMQATEKAFRQILADAPDNIYVLRALWNLLQCGGRSREALALVGRAFAIRPLAAANNYPRAQLLWIVGRTAEADRVIDSAMLYWPEHRYVRFARFTILAFTGRPGVALTMLQNPETTPQNFSPASVSLWKTSLPALQSASTAAKESARRANLDAAQREPTLTAQAVLTLCALGDVDGAFSVANTLLLFRQPVDREAAGNAPQAPQKSTAWRFTPWLFTPPCAVMRADPRFTQLCDGIGLTDYWRVSGTRPDYLRA